MHEQASFSDQSNDIAAVRRAWQGARLEYDELVRAWALRELELLSGWPSQTEQRHKDLPLPEAVADLVRENRHRMLGTCGLCNSRAPLLPPEGEYGLSEGPACAWGCARS